MNRFLGRETKFRTFLPIGQSGLAALFGAFGLWQRSLILSRPVFEGQTSWETTARFHVWPWPYKFAVLTNVPAFLAGLLLSWPVETAWPGIPESVANLPSLLLVPILWYWVGSSLDRRWEIRDKTPWIALLIFTVVCLIGAFIRTGYTSFLFPYGVTVWLIAALVLGRIRRRSQIIKQVNC